MKYPVKSKEISFINNICFYPINYLKLFIKSGSKIYKLVKKKNYKKQLETIIIKPLFFIKLCLGKAKNL